MPAPNDPHNAGAPKPAPPPAPAPGSPPRPPQAQQVSTVTLMVQSGQAPGGLASAPAQQAAPPKSTHPLARAWAAIKAWF